MKKTSQRSASAQKHRASDCPSWENLKPTGILCPSCEDGEIVPTRGRFGPMWACSERPRCAFWMNARPTGYVCTHRTGRRECGSLMMEGTKTIPERCSNKGCPNNMPHRFTA